MTNKIWILHDFVWYQKEHFLENSQNNVHMYFCISSNVTYYLPKKNSMYVHFGKCIFYFHTLFNKNWILNVWYFDAESCKNMVFEIYYLCFDVLQNLRCLKSNFTKCGFDFFITVVDNVRFDKTVWSCEHDFEKCKENGVKV